MTRSITLWILAVIITLGFAIYQRTTGPSYPISGTAELAGSEIDFTLLTSHETVDDYRLVLAAPNLEISGDLIFKRYRSHDDWSRIPMQRSGDSLISVIPRQPAAGKVMYQIEVHSPNLEPQMLTETPVIMRFRGPVPAYVLIPHIFFMFFAMLLSSRTGLEAAVGKPSLRPLTYWTIGLLTLGGMILGPIVQKFAFDAYWTGWPFGTDLTDNKTAVAWIFWLVAAWRLHGKNGRWWVVAASLVTLIIFLIPHSLLGSELDYTAMEES